LKLRISLKSTAATLPDNARFQFALANGNVTVSGNGLTTALTSSDQTKNQIAVVATKLAFSLVPSSVIINQSFNVSVQARDANDNVDLDDSTSVTITRASGSGALTGGGAQNLAGGARNWSLQYNGAGTFTIQAAGGSLTSASSGNITVVGRPLAISGYLANPAGNDSPYEYVQLIALEPIDFSSTPLSVVWLNNGTATTNGWVEGGAISYKFNITAGNLAVGDIAYVGGSGKLINGAGSTDISGQTWLRAIDTGSTGGDGFGSAISGGVLGNGGANADGIAIFVGTALTHTSAPIDAVFFGAAVGAALVNSGTDGYVLPVNDLYNGGFLQSGSAIFGDPASGAYTKLSGTYSTTSSQWIVPRTASSVAGPTALSNLASGITLVAVAPEPTTNSASLSFSDVGPNAMTVSWTSGNGANRIAVVRAGSAASFTPSDANGISGIVSADFSAATDQGSGNKVCYDGAGSSFTLTNLAQAATYFVKIYEYNGSGSSANYLTSGTPASGSQSTSVVSNAGPAQISFPGNGAVSIKFFGVPNNQYAVKTATNVAGPWWPLSTNTAGNDGSWIFTDPNATNAQQYYRIALP